jgi:hypothetical protein
LVESYNAFFAVKNYSQYFAEEQANITADLNVIIGNFKLKKRLTNSREKSNVE